MAGSKEGGIVAAKVNKQRYGSNYYRIIGQMGGKKSKTGGFASEIVGPDGLTGRQRASIVGAKGGSKSKRKAEK